MNHSNHVVSSAITAESIADSSVVAPEAVAQYALGLGDDSLVLAHRLGEWIANAPELEEDVALGNIGLDLLGHARSLLTYAGTAWGKSEDDLAYFRGESEFRSRQLFEQPNGDFAVTIARQLIASVYFAQLYRALSLSADPTLAAIAAKAVKEVDYHVDHSVQWLRRLGLGTDLSHERMQRGLDAMWPFVDELFRADPFAAELDGIAVDPQRLRAAFDALVPRLIVEAGLTVPTVAAARGGGRHGLHSEARTDARRDAGTGSCASGGDLVRPTTAVEAIARPRPETADELAIWNLAATVVDPEVPVLTIEDLGVLRRVAVEGSTVVVEITPTYSGCPAVDAIRDDIGTVLGAAGYENVVVRSVLAPAWTTDWMSDAGRAKLEEYGVAAPAPRATGGAVSLGLGIRCPHCGSLHTRELSRFGSTSCKALYVCQRCQEPFDYFKEH